MTYSKLASTTGNSPKKGSRQGASIDTFLIHHMASTGGEAVTRMMRGSGGREVSANYTIHNDGTIHGVVPEESRAWTSGAAGDGGRGAAWDRRSITVEIENESDDPSWRISDAAVNAAARLLADLRTRYGIRNVIGHRDLWSNYRASYPTYCPGPDTVRRIIVAEQSESPAPKPQPATGSGVTAPPFPLPAGHYFGPRYPLSNTRSVSGYYSHREDLRRWQLQMEKRGWDFSQYGADGLYGDETGNNAEGFQREKGLTVDRLIGPETWRAAWEAPIT